jgi:hypothetical protein
MRPIRAIPSSDEPSDHSGGTPARTAPRSYGSARPRAESCRLPAERCLVWGLVNGSRRAGLVLGWGHCHRRHRPAPGGSCADHHQGRRTRPQAGRPPEPATRPGFDRHRARLLLSLHPPRAWLAHHRLHARPSRICRDPRGSAPSARPFFCWFLGAVEQHLIPIDSLPGFIAVGQLSPSGPKGIQFQPTPEPALHGFVGGQTRRQPPPPNSRHQHLEQGVQTLPIVVRRTPIATPDHRRENRLKEPPHVLGHLSGKISQLHTSLLSLAFDPGRIKQRRGFVS